MAPGFLLAAFCRGAQMEVRPSMGCRDRQVMVQSYQVTQGRVCISGVCVCVHVCMFYVCVRERKKEELPQSFPT